MGVTHSSWCKRSVRMRVGSTGSAMSVEWAGDARMSQACQRGDRRLRRHFVSGRIIAAFRAGPGPSPVGVFALAAACAGTLIWTLESQDRAEQRSQAADMAGDHVQALQRAIELALS